jgi:hypothetical protein
MAMAAPFAAARDNSDFPGSFQRELKSLLSNVQLVVGIWNPGTAVQRRAELSALEGANHS